MKELPKIISKDLTLSNNDQSITIRLLDYGLVAHAVTDLDGTPLDLNFMRPAGALSRLLYVTIKKPCMIETPSSRFLTWPDGQLIGISFSAPTGKDPVPMLIEPSSLQQIGSGDGEDHAELDY